MPKPKLVIDGADLRRLRLAKFLSRQQLADLIDGISVRRIEQFESATVPTGTTPQTALKLAAALRCQPEDFTQVIEQEEASA